MKYKVMFDYSIPQFTDIDVYEKSLDEAEIAAMEVFKGLYPEALDVQVVEVKAQDA